MTRVGFTIPVSIRVGLNNARELVVLGGLVVGEGVFSGVLEVPYEI